VQPFAHGDLRYPVVRIVIRLVVPRRIKIHKFLYFLVILLSLVFCEEFGKHLYKYPINVESDLVAELIWIVISDRVTELEEQEDRKRTHIALAVFSAAIFGLIQEPLFQDVLKFRLAIPDHASADRAHWVPVVYAMHHDTIDAEMMTAHQTSKVFRCNWLYTDGAFETRIAFVEHVQVMQFRSEQFPCQFEPFTIEHRRVGVVVAIVPKVI